MLRLPLVEHRAGEDLHGRHRVARPRGALAGLAITTRTELLAVILAGLFLIEVLSVMIQVGFFKTTRKRVFRMAPLHHHFEMVGWQEITVTVRFWIIAGLFVALGLGIFYAEWVVGTS